MGTSNPKPHRIIKLLVVLRFRSSHLNVPRILANFGIGPLLPNGDLPSVAAAVVGYRNSAQTGDNIERERNHMQRRQVIIALAAAAMLAGAPGGAAAPIAVTTGMRFAMTGAGSNTAPRQA